MGWPLIAMICYLLHPNRLGFMNGVKSSTSRAEQSRHPISNASGNLPSHWLRSIISGRNADVSITSNPSNAHVAVRDDVGREVAEFHTPGVAKLSRRRKYYACADTPPRLKLLATSQRVPIRSTPNPWLLADILLGGLPGLVVDGATSAAWQPRPSQIHQDLVPYQQNAGIGGQ